MTDVKPAPMLLIADDDPEIISLLTIRLQRLGYEVITAVDGKDTLEKVCSHYPDLVILDVMMPEKNGWEVAKELRRDARFQSIGILMLTAIGEKMNEMTSPLYGADDFIDKPFEFSELEKKISATLAKRGKTV